ncbi:MAG: hypothetical protein ACYTCU_02230 [Planctomycetota bacterium]
MRNPHRLIVTSFCFSLLAAAGVAQTLSGEAQATSGHVPPNWSETYGGPLSQQGLYDVRRLPGGQLVAAGYTGAADFSAQSNWLLNLDLGTGSVNTQTASTSAFGGIADGAAIAADGGALFVGRNVLDIFVKHDAWVMRVDAAGEPVWSTGFGNEGVGRYFLFDAEELADGSWIAVGSAGLIDEPPQAAWVVRLSSAGDLLWQQEYGGGIAESAEAVTPTSDGGFAVAGRTNSSGAGSDDVWVMKLDSAGAIQWQKTFGGMEADVAEDIVALDDGGFAVVGSTDSLTPSSHAPWVLRLDAAGTLLWQRAVGSGVWGDLGAVAQTVDGHLVVVGRVGEPGFQTNDLWCAKLDVETGRMLWQRAYEGAQGDFGSAVLPLSTDRGFVIGGTWGWGFPGEAIWLLRTGRTGDLDDCDIERVTTFSMLNKKITKKDGTTVQTPGIAVIKVPGMQIKPSPTTVTDICVSSKD